MLRIRNLVAGAALLLALVLPSAALADDANVSVQDFQFSPTPLQISAGTTVTFTFDGAQPHTVTADDGSFDSGVLNQGQSFTQTFGAPGTYAYYCTLHGSPGGIGMAGSVVVS